MNISKYILLTGAGFSNNYGGFLAEGMWSHIFNHPQIQACDKIKKLLKNDFDYESIYTQVLSAQNDKYPPSCKTALRTAVMDAYRQLDSLIRNHPPSPNASYGLHKFISRMYENRNEVGVFFTLNQDIAVERRFESRSKPLILPQMKKIPYSTGTIDARSELTEEHFFRIPETISNQTLAHDLSTTELHYVKLHGSFNWKSSDGTDMMVIGKDKKYQINREQLLKWYMQLFREVLFEQDRRLLVIGYGFQDKHINKVIAIASETHGLKLFVVSPESPKSFFERLKDRCPHGEDILKGLSGYFPHKLLDSEMLEHDRFKLLEASYLL